MKKHFLSLALAVALVLGLAVPALAAGQTFSDVPSSYWGYADIEAVAEAGLMNGTGGGAFSPEMKVSVAQFLTLLGRLVFPDVKAEGSDWFGPYVTAAKDAGLLNGTQVNVNNVEAEISRYDMAVILRAAAKKLGVAEKSAQSSEVKDFGVIPNMYTEAVLAVYGMGLIKGDQAGNFNGSNTMMRAEVATVIMRLAKAKPGGTTTEPDLEKPEQPAEPEMYHTVLSIKCYTPEAYEENSEGKCPLYGIPVQLRYTEDGGKTSQLIGECTSYLRGTGNFVTLELDLDRALLDNESGQFYFSAETTYEGQKLVSQDLRTDGRATIVPVDVVVPEGLNYKSHQVELVPPTGFKRNVTIRGFVHSNSAKMEAMPDISVDLVLYRDATGTKPSENEMGIVLGSAVSDENGEFLMTAEIDTLDFYINMRKCYRMEAHGNYNEKQWISESWPFNSLSELTHIVPSGMPLPRVPIQMKPI